MKKILTLDGGGIHGLFSLEILDRMEGMLRAELGRGEEFRLSQYFDLIAGTSTGALIASLLAWGLSVAEIRDLYLKKASDIFRRRIWRLPWTSKFSDDPISRFLMGTFAEADGSPSLLGTSGLKTLLLVVLKNGTSGSPWPLTNHPSAKYNDRSKHGVHSNLNIPLWQVVRASTAAPTFFPPQRIQIEGREFEFIDGGMTPFNNPSHLAYLMATLPEYRIGFPEGEKELLLVSVGTGQREMHYGDGEGQICDMYLPGHIRAILVTLMAGAVMQQDLLCRIQGACRFGAPIDSEVGNLIQQNNGRPKAFTYLRYNYRYSDTEVKPVLARLKCEWELDSLRLIPFVRERGAAYAQTAVQTGHFGGFMKH